LLFVANVCRRWSQFIKESDEYLWKPLCCRFWRVHETFIIAGQTNVTWKSLWFNHYSWDESSKSKGLIVTNKMKTAKRPGHIGLFPIIKTKEKFRGGLFQIRVDAPSNWIMNSMSVGLLNLSAFMELRDSIIGNRIVGRVENSFGYTQESPTESALMIEGKRKPADEFGCGDFLSISLNVQTRDLTFLKNGKVQGEPRKIPWPADYYLAISFASDTQVTIKDTTFSVLEHESVLSNPAFFEEISNSDGDTSKKRKDTEDDFSGKKLKRVKKWDADEMEKNNVNMDN